MLAFGGKICLCRFVLHATAENNRKSCRWLTAVAMQDNINVLCKEHQVRKLISCLSTCIFPDKASYPIGEDALHDGPPHASNEGYAFAKRMIDVQNKLYRNQFGCNFTSVSVGAHSAHSLSEVNFAFERTQVCMQVIPTNVFGKHDNFSLTGGHVIPCLIHKCYLAKKNNTDLVVLGSGRPLRQFIYSSDLARLMIWAIRDYSESAPIILSGSEEVSIADASLAVAEAFSFTGKIMFDTSKSDGQYQKTASNKKLMSYLPHFEFTPLSEALAETVQWFTANVDVARK